MDKRLWVNLVFRIKANSFIFFASVRPTSDVELRRQVIEVLANKCGFRTFFKNKEHIGNRYTNLGSESIVKWKDDEEPEDEVITSEVNKKLEELAQRLAAITEALRPLFSN